MDYLKFNLNGKNLRRKTEFKIEFVLKPLCSGMGEVVPACRTPGLSKDIQCCG